METRPLDRSELQSCMCCSKGMMHAGAIHFYEISFSQCVVDLHSVRQQHGLEVMMGAAAPLAAVLAPSTRVAVRLETVRRLLCADCAMNNPLTIALMEQGSPDVS